MMNHIKGHNLKSQFLVKLVKKKRQSKYTLGVKYKEGNQINVELSPFLVNVLPKSFHHTLLFPWECCLREILLNKLLHNVVITYHPLTERIPLFLTSHNSYVQSSAACDVTCAHLSLACWYGNLHNSPSTLYLSVTRRCVWPSWGQNLMGCHYTTGLYFLKSQCRFPWITNITLFKKKKHLFVVHSSIFQTAALLV